MAKKSTFNNPDSQEREYTRLLRGYSKQLQRDVNAVLIPRLGQIKAEYEADLKRDSWIDTLALAMAELAALALYGANTVFQRLPSQFNAVSKFNEGQFKLVVKANTGLTLPPVVQGAPASALLGVNVFRSEPFLKPLAEGWIAENTSLIKSLPTKMHPELEGIIRRGVMNGESVKSLAAEIKARYGVTDARATLIAQDQILTLNADLTRYRLQSVGVKQFKWNSVGDSRVRPAHAELNGRVFSWEKPHPTEGFPGSRIRCRCRASGVWPGDEESTQPAPVVKAAPPKAVDFKGTNFINTDEKEVIGLFAKIPSDQLSFVQSLPKPASIENKANAGFYKPSAKQLVADIKTDKGLVLFHEYGHHIDRTIGKGVDFSHVDEAFGKAFDLDKKALGLVGKSSPTSLADLKNELFEDKIISKSFKTGKTIFYNSPQLKESARSGVSDTIDALSAGAFQNAHGAFGHGKAYFKAREMRLSEAFANIFELRASKDHWEYAKTKFPNMTKRMDEVINEFSK